MLPGASENVSPSTATTEPNRLVKAWTLTTGGLGWVSIERWVPLGGCDHARSLPDTLSRCQHLVSSLFIAYIGKVPKLWNQTIEAHRNAVHDAIIETTAALVTRHGLRSVTMSQIAEETGIGRATLYKYFTDVEAILVAWHERHVTAHLEQLAALGRQAGKATDRLKAVLEAYALIQHKRLATEVGALLHRDEHVGLAQKHLSRLIRGLLIEGVEVGDVRDDVAPEELASYCLFALAAASSLRSEAAVRRLVAVTLGGLRPASVTSVT
jgi:AcrR family transcriptional regulator